MLVHCEMQEWRLFTLGFVNLPSRSCMQQSRKMLNLLGCPSCLVPIT